LTDTINAQLKGTEAYTYDAINRLTQINQSGTGVVPKRVNMTYTPVYQLETLNRFSDLAGTQLVASSTHTYDPLNRLTQVAHAKGATALNTYGYAYDAASRIIQMTSVDGSNAYTYDDTDQLTGASYSGQNNETYGYDLNGNRTNAGYQTTSNNRLQTDGTYSYTYDDEGNLTQRATLATNEVTEYTWDYRNRLTQVTVKNAVQTIIKQVNFTYDALNRRIEKKIDSDGSGPNPASIERFIYDRDHIKLVFNGSNTLTRRYLHGPMIDQILADENVVPKQISWPLSDHQGTVRDLVNNSGIIQNHLRYDSFGKIVSQTASALTPRFAYTGREWDSEIGLYFYRARYYDPTVGRFIGEDPIGFAASDANLYRYVHNSPPQWTDPFGENLVNPILEQVQKRQRDLDEARGIAEQIRTKYGGWKNVLPDCPCTEQEAKRSGDYMNEGFLALAYLWYFHPGAANSYRSKPREYRQGGRLISRPGQQCTYDPRGNLITSGKGAGTPDFSSPADGFGGEGSQIHRSVDVWTWRVLGWHEYSQTWRPNQGKNCKKTSCNR
jgi:RHS repeat-associated protein